MRLRMKRGDGAKFAMQVTTTDPATGLVTPVDLTNASIALVFTVKRRLTDTDVNALFALTRAGGGIVVTEPLAGRLEVRLTAANTSSVAPPETFHWDVQMTAGGLPTTLDSGLLYVEPDVTLA